MVEICSHQMSFDNVMSNRFFQCRSDTVSLASRSWRPLSSRLATAWLNLIVFMNSGVSKVNDETILIDMLHFELYFLGLQEDGRHVSLRPTPWLS